MKSKILIGAIAAVLLIGLGMYIQRGCTPLPVPSIKTRDSLVLKDSTVIREVIEEKPAPTASKDTVRGNETRPGHFTLDEYFPRSDSGFYRLQAWSPKPIDLRDVKISGSPIIFRRVDTSIYRFTYQSKYEKETVTRELRRFTELNVALGRTFELSDDLTKIVGAWEVGLDGKYEIGDLQLVPELHYNTQTGVRGKASAKVRVFEQLEVIQ